VRQAQWELFAVPDSAKAIDQEPGLPEAYCNRGFAHFKKAQWALAITDLDKAYTLEPTLDRGYWNKEWARGKQAQWDVVIADYEKVIALVSDSIVTPLVESSSVELKEELTLALADYNKAMELSQDSAFVQKMEDAIKFIEEWSKGIDK
jgi:tetratricopeptide (TPR) repeat protein